MWLLGAFQCLEPLGTSGLWLQKHTENQTVCSVSVPSVCQDSDELIFPNLSVHPGCCLWLHFSPVGVRGPADALGPPGLGFCHSAELSPGPAWEGVQRGALLLLLSPGPGSSARSLFSLQGFPQPPVWPSCPGHALLYSPTVLYFCLARGSCYTLPYIYRYFCICLITSFKLLWGQGLFDMFSHIFIV